MRIKGLHRISAVLMSLFLLTSSFGFTIDFHFCGNEIQSFSFLGKAQECSKDKMKSDKKDDSSKSHACCHKKKVVQTKPCHQSEDNMKPGKCCQNKTLHVENDDVNLSNFTQNLLLKLVSLQVVYAFNAKTNFSSTKVEHCFLYKPPPILTDVSTAFQVFRI